MKIIQEILMCPLCQSDLRDNLTCKGCKEKFNFKPGVYDVVSEKLSSNQEILWEITDEMIEQEDGDNEQKEDHDAFIKEYNSYKNSETLEAQELERVYMEALVEDFSGIVCDLSTGMGSMLQKMLNAENKSYKIVCTDIDKRILMMTRKLKETNDERVSYVASDGRYMSFKESSFDYVTSLGAFGNIPENEKVARELYRILKPNGKVVIQGIYIEKDSKSYELAKSKNIERGIVEEYLISDLREAGFENIKSTVVAEAVWAENPFDLLPVAGDTQRYCVIEAQRMK